MHRRHLLKSAALATLATNAVRAASANADASGDPTHLPLSEQLSTSFSRPVFVATWPFGQAACNRSREVLAQGGSMLDAVEKGINVTELDTKVHSVGLGGMPNANGVVQLDASFMDGATHKAGAVSALEGYPNPISVARRIMESTKHVMLTSKDAAEFARQQGFIAQDMLTAESRAAWEKWKSEQAQGIADEKSHDTIALLGVDSTGHLVAGCSTSGLAWKLPGRVGDSPLIGSGMYVDGSVGAAGATGVGENVLRYCGSFLTVEFMRQGMSPTDACIATIRRIAAGDKKSPSELSVNFVAINKEGVVGAAGTDEDFRMAIVDSERSLVVKPTLVTA